MYRVFTTWDEAVPGSEDEDDQYWLPLRDALRYAKWLLERPAARILPGYTVTVVEVGV